jgi:dimethylamine monooxygenase subunit B
VSGGGTLRVRVSEIETVAERIKRFRLVSADDRPLPLFSAGAHIVVSMHDGDRLRRNPYSLMGAPHEHDSYQISVLRTLTSRGGSVFMHDRVAVGTELDISYPTNLFPLDLRSRKYVLVAGGIGITPIKSMAEQLSTDGRPFELHYAMRGRQQGAYWQDLRDRFGPRVHVAFDAEGGALDLTRMLGRQPLGTSLYVCGPGPMIDWVLGTATAAGWPSEALHAERFLAPAGGKPFTVELARSEKTITVGEHDSLLEAMEAAGVDAPYLCRGGACGQCETTVLASDGTLLHTDHFLTPQERASGQRIMPCVSRFEGRTLVLDR